MQHYLRKKKIEYYLKKKTNQNKIEFEKLKCPAPFLPKQDFGTVFVGILGPDLFCPNPESILLLDPSLQGKIQVIF